MAHIQETQDNISNRLRNGKIAVTLAVGWWVASVGGIIYVINQS